MYGDTSVTTLTSMAKKKEFVRANAASDASMLSSGLLNGLSSCTKKK
jgi:hypothetical protein